MRRHAAANRERILAAADEVFGRPDGPGSTEEVARRAEVGIATVFRHFPTKQALVEATLVRRFTELDSIAERLGAAAPGSAFEELIRTMVGHGATKLALAQQLGSGQTGPELAEAAARVRARVAEALSRAQADGTVRADATLDEVYLLVSALAHVSTGRDVSRAAEERALHTVLDGLRAGRREDPPGNPG